MSSSSHAIAIVGMGCRFPGSPDLDAFWRTVTGQKVCYREVPPERWDHARFYHANPRTKNTTYAKKIAMVDDIYEFSPSFFRVTPKRAELMDPQQRLFMDVARHAFEDAGCFGGSFPRDRTGVYVGLSVSEHKSLVTSQIRTDQLLDGRFGRVPPGSEALRKLVAERVPRLGPHSMVGQMHNMAAANVSQAFALGGPSFSTDAACSASLVALNEAVLHLRHGLADLALVGGVYITLSPEMIVAFSRIGAISQQDACCPFDESADGFVLGEGAGAIVLKRLEDAQRDRDRIWAVINGVGINNDGRGTGPMTPQQEGQTRCLEAAYRDAKTDPATISYLEAHGTATRVGDATESASLKEFFDPYPREGGRYLGAVKANVGHALSAASVAGIIKTALALHHRTLPGLANFQSPRAELKLEEAGFLIPTSTRVWNLDASGPRRAGVSSFGFGGTNVHAVLEEAPTPPARVSAPAVAQTQEPWPQLFVLSAPSIPLIRKHCADLLQYLESLEEPPSLASIAFTLGTGRARHAHRVAFVADDHHDLFAQLERLAAPDSDLTKSQETRGAFSFPAPDEPAPLPGLAFLFPGQGAQQIDLARDLYERWPTFRSHLEALAGAVDGEFSRPLLSYLYPDPGATRASPIPAPPGESPFRTESALESLTQTEICQPVLTAVSLALNQFLQDLGLCPNQTVGHSLGEFVAAAAGGLLDPAQTVQLVAARGQSMKDLGLQDTGAMLAVAADAATTRTLAADFESHATAATSAPVIANLNHPKQTVVSGATPGVEAFQAYLSDREVPIQNSRLNVSHAFHSPRMAPVSKALEPKIDSLVLSPPRAQVVSCVRPGLFPESEKEIRQLLGEHASSQIDFRGGVERAHALGARIFVQIGGGSALVSMARKTLLERGEPDETDSIRTLDLGPGTPDRTRSFLEALADLISWGFDLNLRPLFPSTDDIDATWLPPSRLETETLTLLRPETEDALTDAVSIANAEAFSPPRNTVMSPPKPSSDRSEPTPSSDLVALFAQQTALLQTHAEIMRRQAETLAGQGLSAPESVPAPNQNMAEPPPTKPQSPQKESFQEPDPLVSTPTSTPVPPQSSPQTPANARRNVHDRVLAAVAQVSAFPPASLKPHQRLRTDLGFDSLMAVELSNQVGETFEGQITLSRTLFVNDTTIEELVDHVTVALGQTSAAKEQTEGIRKGTSSASERYEVVLASQPLTSLHYPHGAEPILIVPDEMGVARELKRKLEDRGKRVFILDPGDEEHAAAGADAVIDLRALSTEPLPSTSARAYRLPVERALRLASQVSHKHPPAALFFAYADPCARGLTGLAKALRREWPTSLCKGIEVERDLGPRSIADLVAKEFLHADTEPEVVYEGSERNIAIVRSATLSSRPINTSSLPERSVVVISGGGRGLGARLALKLAQDARARLVLLGRSPADEEVRQLIRKIQDAGGNAQYMTCDVRQFEAVQSTLDKARRSWGPVESVVHTAGVLADGPVTQWDAKAMDQVFDTKVAGAIALWKATQADPLRNFLMYGSWAGRFGSADQACYAAANHVLADLARQWTKTRSRVRVATLDLPPWEDSSMVNTLAPAVQQAMREQGIPFLSDAQGLEHVCNELQATLDDSPSGEFVIGRQLAESDRRLEAFLRLGLDSLPYLEDHRIAGVPVLPMMAAADLAARGGLELGVVPRADAPLVLKNLAISDAIRVENEGTELRIEATGTRRRGKIDKAHVSLQVANPGRSVRPAYTVQIETGDLSSEPLPPPQEILELDPQVLTLETFYDKYTFHGPRLQGIKAVTEIGPNHIRGEIRTGSKAISFTHLDVLAWDSCLQLCGFFARYHWQKAALPVAFDSLVVRASLNGYETVRCLAVLERSEGFLVTGTVDITAPDGLLLAQLRGVRAELMDAAQVLNPTLETETDVKVATPTVSDPGPETHDAPIDPENRDIAAFPEVQELQQRIAMATAIGLKNPYFKSHERVTNETSLIDGEEYLNFASYNYLGLSGDPDVSRAGIEAIERYGTSVSASRIASGEKPLHRQLERELADFLGCEDSIVLVSGHATNVSVIGHLMGPGDLILHDGLAHDSILGGAHLSGARRRPFAHNDVDALESMLKEMRPHARRVLITVEGIYSMDGDITPLDRIVELKKKYGALLLVDEAHSIGVLGDTGRGVGEHYDVDRSDVDLWMGTMSKAMASCGGYIAGSKVLVDYLKYTVPGFVYSVGISPANAASALCAIRKLRQRPELVQRLVHRARLFFNLCRDRGINTGLCDGTPVVPAIVPNSMDCLRLAQALADRKINVQPILYPAVEEDQARLRFFVTARHTEEQLRNTADALLEELELINPEHLLKRTRGPTSPLRASETLGMDSRG